VYWKYSFLKAFNHLFKLLSLYGQTLTKLTIFVFVLLKSKKAQGIEFYFFKVNKERGIKNGNRLE